jgi:glycosyltransferase involved in cell wall biosynthesis
MAVVAYEMEGRPTGVGRYLEGLLMGIARLGWGGRCTLFFKGDAFSHPLWEEYGSRFEPYFDGHPEAHPILWEQLRLPQILKCHRFDLLFSPANALPPIRNTPRLVTIHDLSFEHLGEDFGWKERWRRRFLARRAARTATRVLTDSGFGARDLVKSYGVEPTRLGIVPLGLDSKFFTPSTPGADTKILTPLGVRPPYLLLSCTLLPRRRPDLVIAAFAAVAAEDSRLQLVLNGSNALPRPENLDDLIAASGVGDRIVRLGYVPEEALVPLYRGAELTFYVSALEGFGLPPLEALAAGTVAVVSYGQALDDLWPEYPYRCARLDGESVLQVTRTALTNRRARQAVGKEGVERMRKLSWELAAEAFLAEVEHVLAPQ